VQYQSEIDFTYAPRVAVVRPDFHFSKGPAATRKLRIACQACNSGWMSRIESQVKPYLLDIMTGAKTPLGVPEQEIVATWIVLFTIVAEFTDKKTLAIPAIDRETLRTQSLPPPSWRIWAGLHDADRWRHNFLHHAVALYPRDAVPSYPAPYNCQFITIGLGAALFHAVRTPFDPSFLRFSGIPANKLAQLWPVINPLLDLRSMNQLLPIEADAVSNEFAFPAAK
jgi:hypothetical protein